ncbi:MAG TPA: hypothetical protein VMV90_11140 [Rectinemataceae bacterium]|nr:hypothetical protein [Rectinemataceae bacterium]
MSRLSLNIVCFGLLAAVLALLGSCASLGSAGPAAPQQAPALSSAPGSSDATEGSAPVPSAAQAAPAAQATAAAQAPAAAQAAAAQAAAQTQGAASSEDRLAEMDSDLAKAKEAADNDHLAEAMRAYVSVLALAAEKGGPAGRTRADGAAAALSRIGQSLSLEPGSEWVDAAGTQTAAGTRGVGSGSGRSPSVYLYENFGTGKSPVGDVPIRFQFIRNSGSIVSTVTTDAFGKANTTLASLADPGSEAVIRAYPIVTANGRSYSFSSVFRDFAYLPPANAAAVFAMADSELGTEDKPQILDAAIRALASTGLRLSPYDGALDPEAFRRALGGDASALASLGIGAKLPYAAFVSVDVEAARQIVLDGVAYNLFTAVADVGFRLVRSDGSVVAALPLDPVKGQGGSKEAAIADAYRRASKALAAALQEHANDIRAALAAN